MSSSSSVALLATCFHADVLLGFGQATQRYIAEVRILIESNLIYGKRRDG
jgi:hypothetical protein